MTTLKFVLASTWCVAFVELSMLLGGSPGAEALRRATAVQPQIRLEPLGATEEVRQYADGRSLISDAARDDDQNPPSMNLFPALMHFLKVETSPFPDGSLTLRLEPTESFLNSVPLENYAGFVRGLPRKTTAGSATDSAAASFGPHFALRVALQAQIGFDSSLHVIEQFWELLGKKAGTELEKLEEHILDALTDAGKTVEESFAQALSRAEHWVTDTAVSQAEGASDTLASWEHSVEHTLKRFWTRMHKRSLSASPEVDFDSVSYLPVANSSRMMKRSHVLDIFVVAHVRLYPDDASEGVAAPQPLPLFLELSGFRGVGFTQGEHALLWPLWAAVYRTLDRQLSSLASDALANMEQEDNCLRLALKGLMKSGVACVRCKERCL